MIDKNKKTRKYSNQILYNDNLYTLRSITVIEYLPKVFFKLT